LSSAGEQPGSACAAASINALSDGAIDAGRFSESVSSSSASLALSSGAPALTGASQVFDSVIAVASLL
jgi:hypothetical protein